MSVSQMTYLLGPLDTLNANAVDDMGVTGRRKGCSTRVLHVHVDWVSSPVGSI